MTDRRHISAESLKFLQQLRSARERQQMEPPKIVIPPIPIGVKIPLPQHKVIANQEKTKARETRQIIDFNDTRTAGFQSINDLHKATEFQSSQQALNSKEINHRNRLAQSVAHKHLETRGEVRKLVGYIALAKDRHCPKKKYQCDECYMIATITPLDEYDLRRHYNLPLSAPLVNDNFTEPVKVFGRVPYVLSSVVYDMKIQETFHSKDGWQWKISECLTRPRFEEAKHLRKFMNAVLLHDLEDSEEAYNQTATDLEVKKAVMKAQISKDIAGFLKVAYKKPKAKKGKKRKNNQSHEDEEDSSDTESFVDEPVISPDEYIAKNWRSWLETLAYGQQILLMCQTKEASIARTYPLINLCYDGASLFRNNPWWTNMSEKDKSKWENALKNPTTAFQLCFRESFPPEFKFMGTFVNKDMVKNREKRAMFQPPHDAEDEHQIDALDLEYSLEEVNLIEASSVQVRTHARATCIPAMRPQGFRELCNKLNWVGVNLPVTPQQILNPPIYLPNLNRQLEALDAYEKFVELSSDSDASCCIHRSDFSLSFHKGIAELLRLNVLTEVSVNKEDYCIGAPEQCAHQFDVRTANTSNSEISADHELAQPSCNLILSTTWANSKQHLARLLVSFQSKFRKSSDKFKLNWKKFLIPRQHRTGITLPDTASLEDKIKDEERAQDEAIMAGKRVLNDKEYEFLRSVELNPVTILTGSAGTGKTSLLALLDQASDSDMNIGAFIGRAAKNAQARVKCKVNTLHSFIAQRRLRFRKFHIFAFDEAGTVHERLMMKFFSGGWYSERLVLVGDVNQIPPFGTYRGNVLFELMQVFPVVTLTHVYRQSTTNQDCKILKNAYRVLDKQTNLLFDNKSFKIRTQATHMDQMLDEYAKTKFENVQFICGTNAHCFDVNQRAFHRLSQNKFSHLSRDAVLNCFMPGHRIVFTSRVNRMASDSVDAYFNAGYYTQTNQMERDTRDLFVNGEQDTIVKIVSVYDLPDKYWKRVDVQAAVSQLKSQESYVRNRADMDFVKHQARMKQDPVGAALESHRHPQDSNMLVFLASGRVVRLSDAFSHGYAVTVNKLQGGEDKHIILYIPGYQGERFLLKYFSRNHLYTAITRATESFIFFGDSIKDLQQMILTDPLPHHCYLRLWIRKAQDAFKQKEKEANKKKLQEQDEDHESKRPTLERFGFTRTQKPTEPTPKRHRGESDDALED